MIIAENNGLSFHPKCMAACIVSIVKANGRLYSEMVSVSICILSEHKFLFSHTSDNTRSPWSDICYKHGYTPSPATFTNSIDVNMNFNILYSLVWYTLAPNQRDISTFVK